MREITGSARKTIADKPVIFFDGICGLCNRFVSFLLTLDKKQVFLFSPIQGNTAKANNITLESTNSIVLVIGENRYYKSTAAIKILVMLGGIWKVSKVLFLFPPGVRNFFYDLLARKRYSIFGKQTCRIPTAQEKSRFLP